MNPRPEKDTWNMEEGTTQITSAQRAGGIHLQQTFSSCLRQSPPPCQCISATCRILSSNPSETQHASGVER
eukprot:1742360-Pyramimonas_sp.AAC.1